MPLTVKITCPDENNDNSMIDTLIVVSVPGLVGTPPNPMTEPQLVVTVTIRNAETHDLVRAFCTQTSPALDFTAKFPNQNPDAREEPLRLDPNTAYLICATAKYTNASNVVTFGAKSIIRNTPPTATQS